MSKARSLWLLAGLGEAGVAALQQAFESEDPRFRVLALRVARLHGLDLDKRIADLTTIRPASPEEVALMLGKRPDEEKVDTWLLLANGYDGQDRWYLSALGIAAGGLEDRIFEALRKRHPVWNSKVANLYRVLQAPASVPYLSSVAKDASRPVRERAEALEALGWQSRAGGRQNGGDDWRRRFPTA